MKPVPETNNKVWTDQPWQGNQELNLQCSVKLFSYGTRKIPVWIFGGTEEYKGFSYCVSAGHNSDLSHTGRADNATTLDEAKAVVDAKAAINKLIY